MKANFTKGEWFIERYHTMLDVSVVGHGAICTVDTDHVLQECMIDPTPEQEANAHLIAAAPDMYKMVSKVLEMQKQWYGYGVDTHMKLADMAKEMELLLAKARGVDNT